MNQGHFEYNAEVLITQSVKIFVFKRFYQGVYLTIYSTVATNMNYQLKHSAQLACIMGFALFLEQTEIILLNSIEQLIFVLGKHTAPRNVKKIRRISARTVESRRRFESGNSLTMHLISAVCLEKVID